MPGITSKKFIPSELLLCLVAIAGIGFLIKHVPVPCYLRWEIYGRNVSLFLWRLDWHSFPCFAFPYFVKPEVIKQGRCNGHGWGRRRMMLRASNKMNCRIESERFCDPARRMRQNRRSHSQSYVEDDFGSANAAGHKTSRLNAKAFC